MIGYEDQLWLLGCTTFILACGYVLSANWAGLPNLSIAASYGVGWYAFVILCNEGLGSVEAAAAALAVTTVGGGIIGAASRRLRLDHFALFTLAIVACLQVVATSADGLTGGPDGTFLVTLAPDALPTIGGLLAAAWALGWVVLRHSRWGILVSAFRDDELRLDSLGVSAMRIRILVGAGVGAAGASAGVVVALLLGYAEPSVLSLDTLTPVLLVSALVGRRLALPWLVAAVFVVILVPELTHQLPLPMNRLGASQQLLFLTPVAILLAVRLRRKGGEDHA